MFLTPAIYCVFCLIDIAPDNSLPEYQHLNPPLRSQKILRSLPEDVGMRRLFSVSFVSSSADVALASIICVTTWLSWAALALMITGLPSRCSRSRTSVCILTHNNAWGNWLSIPSYECCIYRCIDIAPNNTSSEIRIVSLWVISFRASSLSTSLTSAW